MSDLLYFSEHRLQEVALAVMALVYVLRLAWLFRFRGARDRQPTTARPGTGPGIGAAYSLANIAMPWAMESTRRHAGFYAQFVALHVGVAAAIALSFIIPYAPWLLEDKPTVRGLQAWMIAAAAVGAYRLARRMTDPVIRAISTPDDYFSVALLSVWLAFGVAAAPNSTAGGEWPLVAYFLLTAFFLLYVPFSKISHYLYYPFTRYWLGRTLGYRGVLPLGPRGHRAPSFR
ncbi:MAG: hypothetical protein ACE148_04895 [Vicinamibacterales bacterium]